MYKVDENGKHSLTLFFRHIAKIGATSVFPAFEIFLDEKQGAQLVRSRLMEAIKAECVQGSCTVCHVCECYKDSDHEFDALLRAEQWIMAPLY